MRAGTSSQTAETVCAGRAIAEARRVLPRFSDPTARVLASDETRVTIDRFLSEGPKPPGLAARAKHGYLEKLAMTMVARTVGIDDAIRAAAAPQLVILGAGLDGRAWRMPELADVTVLEVDHPDTQREKRARAGALTPTTKDLRFVPVDFTRDSLEAALASAGHDATRPTTWVWEGVVMYLTRTEVEATLRVIAARSAKGSTLALLYHQPSVLVWFMGLFVSRMGEPFRSRYRADEMKALLARHGFTVSSDETMHEIGAKLGGEVATGTTSMNHLRLALCRRGG